MNFSKHKQKCKKCGKLKEHKKIFKFWDDKKQKMWGLCHSCYKKKIGI